METTIFQINGGLGKHVLSTGIINSYKKQFPDKQIIVSSAYPDVFYRNPAIHETLNINFSQYFYKNYIYGKDVEIFAQDPYKQSSHILKTQHFFDTWCDLIKIDNTDSPKLYFSKSEQETARRILLPYSNKPIIIFQPFGGGIDQQIPYSWARDIHPILAQEIVDFLKSDYNIIHVCNPHHPNLDGCIRIDSRMDPHVLFSMMSFSKYRILNDSCLQHAANSMNLKSIVYWNVTSPKQFGYDLHENILPIKTFPEGNQNSYFFDYNISGIPSECPYEDFEEVMPIETTLNILKSIIKTK